MAQDMPPDLTGILSGETADFSVKSSRKLPLKKSLHNFLIVSFILAVMILITAAFLVPLLSGKEVRFEVNGAPVVASASNLKPMAIPGVVFGVFLIVSLILFITCLLQLFSEGGWFVGTPTRMIIIRKNDVKSIDWNQFTNNIDVKGTPEKADMTFEMKTGNYSSTSRGGFSGGNFSGPSTIRRIQQPAVFTSRFIPDKNYIVGVRNAFEIEKFCRRRIEEHNPTAPTPANQNAGQGIQF